MWYIKTGNRVIFTHLLRTIASNMMLLLVSILVCVHWVATAGVCPADQIFSRTPCSKTCETMIIEGKCLSEEKEGCECQVDLYRNKNGECVPDTECDEVTCSANNVFKVNGCHHTCKTFLFDEQCIYVGGAACICDDDYYLNSNNECVDASTCKQETDLCPPNKIFRDRPCSRTCETMFTHTECIKAETPGCQCGAGLFMDKNGDCVADTDCDNVICSVNSVFKVDGCQHTCKTFLFNRDCASVAGPACICDNEYYLTSNDECVDVNTCNQETDLCPSNKIFSSTPCSRTCKAMFTEAQCTKEENPGCQCDVGLFLNRNGDCVPDRNCDEVTCSENTVFKVDGCQHTCKTLLLDGQCVYVAGVACVCADDYYLNSKNNCVDAYMCKRETSTF